jgi:thiamine biosynthesis lipoprotein
VAKGWIADRALRLLDRYPAALVDADGDIALSVDPRTGWTIGVADPADPDGDLAGLDPGRVGPRRLGVATSGIDVHRWGDDPGRHHLIDPATGSPAVSDVEQCTVVADSAALAEAVAKAVVIRGSDRGARLLGRSGVLGGVLLLRDGVVLATEEVPAWLV